MDRRVLIDAGPPCARRFGPDDAVVVVDVIRSMTTAVTVAAMGGRCLPVGSLDKAWALARNLHQPLLVGEMGGACLDGFDLTNSPAKIARLDLKERPVVLLSSSGTPLLDAVGGAGAVYPACLSNRRAVAEYIARRHARVAVMGAATHGELREEDQLCCAFIAELLADAGFAIENEETAALIARWSGKPPEAFLGSRSVSWLQTTGQLEDLDFILRHVDNLNAVFVLHKGEIVRAEAVRNVRAAV
jgi:2-phosphosulfolactate phosphatase